MAIGTALGRRNVACPLACGRNPIVAVVTGAKGAGMIKPDLRPVLRRMAGIATIVGRQMGLALAAG